MKKLLLSVVLLSGGAAFAQSWVEQNTGFFAESRGIGEIQIVDANTVWALAYDGSGANENVQEFTKTTDGGITWTPGTIDVGDPNLEINNIMPVSADVAFVSTVDPNAGLGAVYQTLDGGLTWFNPVPQAFQSATSFCNWVHFFDENTGVAIGDPIAGNQFEHWRTTDGGASWELVSTPTALSGEWGYNGGNVAVGNTMWAPTNKGKILRTSDAGATWVKLNSPISDFGAAAINGRLLFSDANTGMLLATTNSGATYVVYRTFDGGSTWSAATPFTGGFNRILTYIPGTTTIVATGISATPPAIPGSAYSNDNGETWTTIDSGEQRGVTDFLDGSTGWAAGFNVNETTGGIFKLDGSLSTNEQIIYGKLKAYPNPTNGILTIAGDAQITEVVLFDLLGKQVLSQEFTAVNQAEVSLSSLQTGAYIARIKDAAGNMQTIQVTKK